MDEDRSEFAGFSASVVREQETDEADVAANLSELTKDELDRLIDDMTHRHAETLRLLAKH